MFFSVSLTTILLSAVCHAAPASVLTTATAGATITTSGALTATVSDTATAVLHAPLASGTGVSTNITEIQSGSLLDNVPNITTTSTFKPEIVFSPIRFPTCRNAIDSKASQLAVNVGNPTTGYVSDSVWGTMHRDYQYGSIYCKDPTIGAFAVYGEIWLKWKATANYGYPITDETTAYDNANTYIRYNLFSQSNAIYWTPNNGAHLIYGDIYQRWLAIGATKSVVGYPITDETSSGTHSGRFNDFSLGMIYWSPGWTYVHTGPIPSEFTITWNPVNLDDVTGSAEITLNSNGNVRWQSNMHDDVPWPYNWEIGFVLMDADGTSISLGQSGSVGPNLGIFGVNDANVDTTVNSGEVSANWRAWVAMTQWRSQAANSIDIGSLLSGLWDDLQKAWPIIATAIEVLG